MSNLRLFKVPCAMLICCVHLHNIASMQTHKRSFLQVKVMKMRRMMKRTVNTTVKRVAQRKVAMKMMVVMKMQCLRRQLQAD